MQSKNSKFVLVAMLTLTLIVIGCKNDDEQPSDGEIGISAITIEQNPSGIAPLTAMLNFTTSRSARISIAIEGDNPVTKTFSELKTNHQVPILGLYADHVNTVSIEAFDDSGNSSVEIITIETGELPEFIPEIEIVEKRASLMEEGWNLVPVTIGLGSPNSFSSPIIFDNDGVIRWYLDMRSIFPTGAIGPFEPLRNGNFLFSIEHDIYEYSLLGLEVNKWSMPDNYLFHHDVIEKPDGNFIVAVDDQDLETIEDIAIEIDRRSGEIVNRWDLRELLDMSRDDILNNEVDWFHMNGIWYDETDNTVIFSGRNQGLAKVNYDNELQWILSPKQGWGNAGIDGAGDDTRPFLLTAVDNAGNPYDEQVQLGTSRIDEFEWVWGQHAPMVLQNGNVFVFDNGFRRNYGPPGGSYSRGVEYRINQQDMTVQQVWQAGKEKGSLFQSIILSDVDVLPSTGNRVVFSGINTSEKMSQFLEVTYPDNITVFEARIKYKYAFVEDNAPLAPGNLDSAFRGERISIYSGF